MRCIFFSRCYPQAECKLYHPQDICMIFSCLRSTKMQVSVASCSAVHSQPSTRSSRSQSGRRQLDYQDDRLHIGVEHRTRRRLIADVGLHFDKLSSELNQLASLYTAAAHELHEREILVVGELWRE